MLMTCTMVDPMAAATEHVPRSLPGREPEDGLSARTIPIITTPPTPTPIIKTSAPSPTAGDPMDITTPTSSAAQSIGRGSDGDASDTNERKNTVSCGEQNSAGTFNNTMPAPTTMPSATTAPAAAAAAVHQPKIVQTAFIHKLYNMLEDPNIQHLISWSSSAESFVMSPSNDFSKVLAQYFKHTNISSFVRQLNMYGFHKVSDVFHTGSPDQALWEFKHGNGNFKRGDLVGLREIKRRASRHALVHRDYGNQKPTPSQPGTPAEPMPVIHDGSDPRLAGIEHSLYEINVKLQRSEETAQYMHIKQQMMVETINKLLQFNQELSRTVLSLVPPENPIHRDILNLQGEIHRQTEFLMNADEPTDPPVSSSRQYFANLENPPVSPRQLAQDSRPLAHPRGANFYRPPVPSNLSIGSRRHYGSISGAPSQSSPSPLRSQAPPPPPGPHPLVAVEPPPNSLARRHTSADIRAHGWQPNPPPSYLGSGPPSSHWPSSPNRGPVDDHRIREAPSAYSLSRPTTPPAPPFSNGNIGNSLESLNSWNWNSASRENKNLSIRDISTPPTRRGSMAHILNPTDTAGRENEDDPRGDDDRKRKRMQ
ncbi:putative flocculation suppression protein [Rosellinia necatrix]|uniref:Putative flocculation suppression protein n=1 Tax=Rosellinia necatrix TaxID=77044 RepID=A0A1S7UKD3_ROSNE|nr:putative flocculation suppression protein [Rosellinia necatrix]